MKKIDVLSDSRPAFEIAEGMTVEEIHALFFDKKAFVLPPYILYQLNGKGGRYYYTFDENGSPVFYPSVTTILSNTLPTSPFLISWIADKGKEEAERYKNERADYGTFMHACFEDLLINKEYDLDSLQEDLKNYIEKKSLPSDFIYYADDLKKDILAFAQFVIDYDVTPIAVEIALKSEKGYAGMVDCICEMSEKKGSDSKIIAIIDFKSGRKGFYEEHAIQLHLYKLLVEENFPNLHIDKLLNFSPKAWRKSPTYNLKEQTKAESAKKIPALLSLANLEDNEEHIFTHTAGTIKLKNRNLDENIKNLTLSELIKEKSEIPTNLHKKRRGRPKGSKNKSKEGKIKPAEKQKTVGGIRGKEKTKKRAKFK